MNSSATAAERVINASVTGISRSKFALEVYESAHRVGRIFTRRTAPVDFLLCRMFRTLALISSLLPHTILRYGPMPKGVLALGGQRNSAI
jgi:hypothetical protein